MGTIDVVQFELSGTNYAIDINTAREIVEMIPITPVPRSPEHIAGIINLRGEITYIMNLNYLMGLKDNPDKTIQKIIILVPDVSDGLNVGLIVDDVHSVLQISDGDVEKMDGSIAKEAFIKGVIKPKENSIVKSLIIWIDIEKILVDTLGLMNPEHAAIAEKA